MKVSHSIDHPWPPEDWLDSVAWDRYWARMIGDPTMVGFATLPFFESFPIRALPDLRQRGARRVLFAGNGISLEPHAWVHAGFDVTALDISRVACNFVQETGLNTQLLARFFPGCMAPEEDDTLVECLNETLSPNRSEQEYRPGGRLNVLTENLFTHTPVESYDAIFSIRSFQGFPPEERGRLAARFYEWLSPGGFCLVEAINLEGERRESLESAFLRAGFFQRGRAVRMIDMRSSSSSNEMDAAHAQDELEERNRLARGEKMVAFIHGSG